MPDRRRLLMLQCLICSLFWIPTAGSAEPMASTSSTGPVVAVQPKTRGAAAAELPAVFSLPAPRNAADLKVIQDHVTSLYPTLSQATVNLSVNGPGGNAQGSGVFVAAEGIILTAAHVTGRPGRPVTVTLHDGSRYAGITLGRNTTLDASLVRIVESDRRDWPALPVAGSKAKAGDWCAVLGHPGGYQRDRRAVLRLGRVVYENKWQIQSDCELVGGDSGGPLFNMHGEVIGINTRIGESTEFNIHVPIEVYTRDWARLMNSEDFRTHSGAYLGVSGIAAPSGTGLLVQKVEAGEAAARAGVKVGDLIISCQGEKVTDLAQLTELIGQHFPGQSIRLVLSRDGEVVNLTARLGARWTE